MTILEEIQIELRRLERHVESLEESWDIAVGRDLAACLRNWVQLTKEIDALAKDEEWKMTFKHHQTPRELKAVLGKGQRFPLSGSVKSGGMLIAGVTIHNRKLTQEEVRQSYETTKNSFSKNQAMAFAEWLNVAGYEIRKTEGLKSIPRKEFIDRCANLLGGTHPVTTLHKGDYVHWADAYIVDEMSTTIGNFPAPYAVLIEAGRQIIETFKPLVQK